MLSFILVLELMSDINGVSQSGHISTQHLFQYYIFKFSRFKCSQFHLQYFTRDEFEYLKHLSNLSQGTLKYVKISIFTGQIHEDTSVFVSDPPNLQFLCLVLPPAMTFRQNLIVSQQMISAIEIKLNPIPSPRLPPTAEAYSEVVIFLFLFI